MKILLILPYDKTYRYKKGSFVKYLKYPPLTLTTLAALVPKELNATVQIIDEGIRPLPAKIDADIIGISVLTATANRAYMLADKLRKEGKTVLLGGIHVTAMPQEAQKHADSVLVGCGEDTFPQALLDYSNNQLKPIYESKISGEVESLPVPNRNLLLLSMHSTPNTIMATRGCPNHCQYCCIPIMTRGQYVKRPINEVIAEIKGMNMKKPFIFLDPNLTADEQYVEELYKAMIPLKIKWCGLTTVSFTKNDYLMDLAVKSGCKGFLMGLETICQQSLQDVSKQFNKVGEYAQAIEKFHSRNLPVLGCFMFGFDSDTPDVFKKTLEFIDNIKVNVIRPTIVTPFPGTKLFEKLDKENRILTYNWDNYDYEHVVYAPSKMSKKELYMGLAWLWKNLYTHKRILKRCFVNNRFNMIVFLSNYAFRYHAMKYYKRVMKEAQYEV